jgi:small subunit ribosomal protein S17e
MGRIRGKFVKSFSRQLVDTYPDKFSKDFTANKKSLKELGFFSTEKFTRNKLAGCLVDEVKKKRI